LDFLALQPTKQNQAQQSDRPQIQFVQQVQKHIHIPSQQPVHQPIKPHVQQKLHGQAIQQPTIQPQAQDPQKHQSPFN
jgi:hypothetical protein